MCCYLQKLFLVTCRIGSLLRVIGSWREQCIGCSGTEISQSLSISVHETTTNLYAAETLKVCSARQKFPKVYGTKILIFVLVRSRHLTLCWATRIRSSRSLFIYLRSILTFFHPRLDLPIGFAYHVFRRKHTSHTHNLSIPFPLIFHNNNNNDNNRSR